MSVLPLTPEEKAQMMALRIGNTVKTITKSIVYAFLHFPYRNAGIFLHYTLNHIWKFAVIILIAFGLMIYLVNSNIKEDCRHSVVMHIIANESYGYNSEVVDITKANLSEACNYPITEK